jgi:hypothetical protein
MFSLINFCVLALIIPWKSIINGGEDGEQASRLFPAFHFAFSHPRLIVDALTLSLCSSLGQLIIYYTIKEFGARKLYLKTRVSRRINY